MANYDKPYKFNIVLNSQQVSTQSSGNDNDCTYEFNWTNIPSGKYRMSFSYRGKNNGDLVVDDSPQVFLSIASCPSVYQANGTSGSVISTFIGTLGISTHANAQAYFYSNLYDNPDVFFNNEPTNGQIRVQIFRDNFITPFTTLAGSNIADYVLVLSFDQIGKVYPYNL